MEDLYPRVMKFVREQPWALVPSAHAIMVDLLAFRNAGGRLTRDEISSRIGTPRVTTMVRAFDVDAAAFQSAADSPARGGGGVIAVIGIYGVISQRQAAVEDLCGPGGTSVEAVLKAFRAAVNDTAVKAIVFDVDSPGGGVYGVPEAAAEIRNARGAKPIVAIANSMAASAAYWLAAQAESISVTPSGELGSVGVYSAHEDVSQAMEMAGRKVTLISAGDYKVEGNPFAPLGEEALAYMQQRVDEYYGMFVKDVAKGRGVNVSVVRSDFGGGRVMGAQESVRAGLADRVETLDDLLRRLSGRRGGASPVTGQAEAPTLGAVSDEPQYERPFEAINDAEVEREKISLSSLTHKVV